MIIKRWIKQFFDYLDSTALDKEGIYLKEDIEKKFPQLRIKHLIVLEDLTLSNKELMNLKKVILNEDYIHPFDTGVISGDVEATNFLKLSQIEDATGDKYVVLFDMQESEINLEEQILWFNPVGYNLISKDKIDKVRVFSF